jgi:hypothetical protein
MAIAHLVVILTCNPQRSQVRIPNKARFFSLVIEFFWLIMGHCESERNTHSMIGTLAAKMV